MELQQFTAMAVSSKGDAFHSRGEAHHAVFFDALDLLYPDEPQADDPNGVWSLPDFWLPEQGCCFSVKGISTDDACIPPLLLAHAPHNPGDLACGESWLRYDTLSQITFRALTLTKDDGLEGDHWWCACPSCDSLGLTSFGQESLLPCPGSQQQQGVTSTGIRFSGPRCLISRSGRLIAACPQARSAQW